MQEFAQLLRRLIGVLSHALIVACWDRGEKNPKNIRGGCE
jgi:hypothetical protein